MNNKKLIAAFIFPERLDWFIDYLNKNFSITKDKIFCYKNLKDDSKLILTFKLDLDGKKINYKDHFPNAISIHKKGTTIYTINALNTLIDTIIGDSLGNVDKKTVKINWSEYQNKIILVNHNQLSILDIERIF